MFPGSFSLYQRALLEQLHGVSNQSGVAADYDLALRASEALRPDEIGHIPQILFETIPDSTVDDRRDQPAEDPEHNALRKAFERRGIQAHLRRHPRAQDVFVPTLRPRQTPSVAIVIPTKNECDMLRECLSSLRRSTSYPRYRVIVIDNQSDDPDFLRFCDEQSAAGRIQVRDTSPIPGDPEPTRSPQYRNYFARYRCL